MQPRIKPFTVSRLTEVKVNLLSEECEQNSDSGVYINKDACGNSYKGSKIQQKWVHPVHDHIKCHLSIYKVLFYVSFKQSSNCAHRSYTHETISRKPVQTETLQICIVKITSELQNFVSFNPMDLHYVSTLERTATIWAKYLRQQSRGPERAVVPLIKSDFLQINNVMGSLLLVQSFKKTIHKTITSDLPGQRVQIRVRIDHKHGLYNSEYNPHSIRL